VKIAAFMVLFPVLAFAASEGAHHEPSINDIWFPLGNFLIYAFILYKYALPLVRDFLKTRREEVISAMAQATAKKQAAEALVADYRNKLAGIDKEMAALHATLREEGEREKSRLITEAQTMSTKLKQDAVFLGEQEMKIARQQLLHELADQAEAGARSLIQRNLTAADQNRLAEEFIENIGHTR
jgi:F-type H+-transporting ATPase subunit b